MKIAFISYEYPPDTAYGGIATYVYQVAQMLFNRGHHVEVFTSSPTRSGTHCEDGLLVHRVKVIEQADFSKPIGKVFAKRHAEIDFDVLEGPDYCADAREAVRLVPDIPFVLKLHTPSIILLRFNYYESSFLKRVYFYARALRRGIKPSWGYDPNQEAARLHALKVNELERLHALDADEIVAPSRMLGEKLIKIWNLDAAKVSHFPHPYIPSEKMLKIPINTCTGTVTYIGRLEMLKGVLDLAQAIPLILRAHPKVKFRFIGPSGPSPKSDLDMQQYLEHRLKRYNSSIEFTGAVALDRIPDFLATTDICVFPSRWDNFPFVCLESMAAGRGIVGSSSGGMADMLNYDQAGRLIPPHSPKRIAEAVIELIANPELRMKLGHVARNRLLAEYNADRVSALQEASYSRAIARRRARKARLSETKT